MKISVSMITLNEEKNITRALSSCTYADEIVVVDGGSTDRTLKILQQNDLVVLIPRPGEKDFDKQRQTSLKNCSGDWVIRLDADETSSEEFEKEVRKLLASTPENIGGYTTRQCHLIGDENHYSKAFDKYETIPRIWRNGPEIRWGGKTNERLTGLRGDICEWDNYIINYGFLDKERSWRKGVHYSKIAGSGYSRPEEFIHKEYDIQPRPVKSHAAPHVPSLKIKKDFNALPKVAIVRGPNLNQWEIQNYEPLSDRFDITLYTTTKPRFDISNLRLPIVQLPTYPEDPSSSYMIGLEAELFDKDVVYSADITWMFTAQATAAKQKFGHQVIVLEWENIPFVHEEDEGVRKVKEGNRLYADIFVAVTERAKDALLLEGVPAEEITVLPMGIDTNRFKPDKAARVEGRQELSIAPEDLVVLYTGRMVWEKGIYDLIYAAKLVLQVQKQKGLPLKFVIIGQGPEREEIQKKVSLLGMDNVFRFITDFPYDKIHEVYNIADMFILPSIATRAWKEQFGMVLIEAMACGLPVISTTSGSISEVVGQAGLLVPSNDPTELSKAIIKLLNEPQLRNNLSRQGRDRALNMFNSKKIADKFGRLFEKAVQDTLHGAVSELAAYSKLTNEEAANRMESARLKQGRQWENFILTKPSKQNLQEFFSQDDSILFSLVYDNYADSSARAWADDILNFCLKRIPHGGKINILDFGGGIGSLAIHLARAKDLKIYYADIPGKTSDYAGWRFDRRGLDVTRLDATPNRCLGGLIFDVILLINVAEYLYHPEDTIRYLIDSLAPEGYLVCVTSFADDNPGPNETLRREQCYREGFYEAIKGFGLEMLNKGLPRIFKKTSDDIGRLKNKIETAVKAQKYDQARQSLTLYLETHPFDLDMLIRYVETCIFLDDLPAARETIEKILLLNPDMPEAAALKQKLIQK